MRKSQTLSNGRGHQTNKNPVQIMNSKVDMLPCWKSTPYLGKAMCLREMHDTELNSRIGEANFPARCGGRHGALRQHKSTECYSTQRCGRKRQTRTPYSRHTTPITPSLHCQRTSTHMLQYQTWMTKCWRRKGKESTIYHQADG